MWTMTIVTILVFKTWTSRRLHRRTLRDRDRRMRQPTVFLQRHLRRPHQQLPVWMRRRLHGTAVRGRSQALFTGKSVWGSWDMRGEAGRYDYTWWGYSYPGWTGLVSSILWRNRRRHLKENDGVVGWGKRKRRKQRKEEDADENENDSETTVKQKIRREKAVDCVFVKKKERKKKIKTGSPQGARGEHKTRLHVRLSPVSTSLSSFIFFRFLVCLLLTLSLFSTTFPFTCNNPSYTTSAVCLS